MSSKSPGGLNFAQNKQLAVGAGGMAAAANANCCPGDFHHNHHHQQQQQHLTATSPDGELVVTRTFSGLSEGSSSRDSGYCVNTSDGASTCSSSTTDAAEGEGGTLLVLEPKSLRSFTTNDEYLYAMKEDLADWFACLYKMDITAENFFPLLETGVLLCQHANKVQDFSQQRREQGETLEMRSYFIRNVPQGTVPCRQNVKPQTFQARDNVSNFIAWGRQLGIPEVLSFETDDLVLRKNEKSVILCLLEIARVGAKLGMLAPTLVQMEQEIDAELAGEEVKPKAQIKTCDMRSLDEMVRDLVGRCTCPVQFPMVKVGDGKYKIGDSRSLIFVRILRNHVMVRVGGGWDTLENYLNKHDPCQCNYRGHRATSLGPKTPQRQPTSNKSSNDVSTASKPNTPNKVISPRRMSTPAVSVTTATPGNPARNRSISPKQQPVRSKSPTLIISRHMQGSQHKPSFSVSNSTCSNSLSAEYGGEKVIPTTYKGNSTNNQNNGGSAVPCVSSSWSQPSGFPSKIPTVGNSSGGPNRTKSPSPGPTQNANSASRLRSPSPLNSRPSSSSRPESNQAKKLTHPTKKFVKSSSSSALLAKGKGQGQSGTGSGTGDIKVGTPRSIKRAAMNSKYEEEEDEYDNDVDDDEYDEDEDDENYKWGKASYDPDLQFNCEDIEAEDMGKHNEYLLPGSVSFDDSCDGPARSRSSLEMVAELEALEAPSDGKKPNNTNNSNMPMEKINTMTLTEFKSLLTNALSVPEEQQKQQQSFKDRENPNSSKTTKPSTLPFSSSNGGGGCGITSTASTPGATEANRQLNWDALRDKARLVRDSISSSVNSRKSSLGGTGTASPGIGRRSLPQSPDDDGSRSRVAYSDNRPKTPQSLRRNNPTAVSRPKTPTSAIARPKTPTSIARPKTPSSTSNQSRARTPNSMERNSSQPREEYKMARSKTPSQMKREAVAKVAGAISNWVESRNELDSSSTSSSSTYRGRPKTPVSSQRMYADDNDEDNVEIMGTLANDHVESLASSVRERPSTPSRIPKPCFTPRPETPKRSGNEEGSTLSTYKEPEQFRPTIPVKPPQSLPLSQQHTYNHNTPLSNVTTPDTDNTFSRVSGGGGTPHSIHIPAAKVITRSHHQPAQSAPSTPGGGLKENRSLSNSINNSSNNKTYKDMYVAKRATTPTQLSSSIPRSQPSRCVTPGPREKWSLGERPTNSSNNNMAQTSSQSRISSYQNGATASSNVSKRRGSLSTEHVSSNINSNQFVVTNEITFSDDEEINEMLKNAALASASEKQERKPRSASVDARRLVRQNAANARQKETVIISRNGKGKHGVQVSKQGSTDSTNSDSVRPLVRAQGNSTDRSHSSTTTQARFRSQTPDPSMFRRKLFSAKSVGSDDIDAGRVGSKSGNKSVNRTEAWVDSTLSDTKRKLPPRPKRANTLGGDIPVSELKPRPLEEIIAILPEQQDELVNVDTGSLDAPPEDPEMYKKMEKLFEKYREMELRASVNEMPGGGGGAKVNAKKTSNPSSSARSFDACSKSTLSVASAKTSSGSVGSSSGRSSSHHHQHATPSTSCSTQLKPSTVKSNSSTSSSIRSGESGGINSSSSSNRYNRSSSAPKTFQKSPSGSSAVLTSSSLSQQSTNVVDSDNHSESENRNISLKDIDAETAKDPTALISKIKEILRVRPRKDANGKIPTRIPAPASLNKNRRSKSVSNLLDQVAEMTMKDNHHTEYNRSNSNSSSQQNGRRGENSDMNAANSSSSTNIAYSEFIFSEKGEEADSVSEISRAWSVQSDSSDSNNRCETPVPKLATPLTTGRSTFINRKLERSGRGLSQDKENALSNSQSSLSSRSALSATEDEADYV